jgi:TatD DNase family protein
VHTRDAAADTLEILREENARDVGGIIHCFSEDAPFAAAALDMGFVSSFSGIVTFRSASAIQEAARLQPLDSILIETDAPYLAPIPRRGKRNEPSYVAHTAAFIAELRDIPVETLHQATYANACRVFGLDTTRENSSVTA